MSESPENKIAVTVNTEYLADQSDPDNNRWVYAYHICIENQGSQSAQLLTRHWIITDSEEQQQEVHGEGIVGQQPNLAPGEQFTYTSGTILETPVGSMHGSYQMIAEDGTCFDAPIPVFTLAPPHTLH